MAETLDQTDGIGGKHKAARDMAEAAIRAQAAGDDDEADRLFAEAARIDPSAVNAALSQQAADPSDSATGTDAEPQDDAEIAAISRTMNPRDAPSRAGITGSGSGADGEGL